jgi:hypothetical protein
MRVESLEKDLHRSLSDELRLLQRLNKTKIKPEKKKKKKKKPTRVHCFNMRL